MSRRVSLPFRGAVVVPFPGVEPATRDARAPRRTVAANDARAGDPDIAAPSTRCSTGRGPRRARAGGEGRAPDRRDPAALRIGGVTPFSSTDFPGRLAAVLFLQGCPWRCGYCHNPHLRESEGEVRHDYASFIGWLQTRAGLLDAVVFSGGEPTAQAALGEAMQDIRSRGFAIGLHTGGAYPRRLAQVLPLVDWVGLDVKAPMPAYGAVTGVSGSGIAANASVRLVVGSGVAHEVRTTVHFDLTPPEALVALADELAAIGVGRWILQPFRPTGCAEERLVAAAPRGERVDETLLAQLRERVPGVEVRDP
jgi:anaerobic ribonucleoside-triphosphate reductase activating protein